MATYKCTLSYGNDGIAKASFVPTRPQNQAFAVGDEITFLSADSTNGFDMRFQNGSPFETHGSPAVYSVPSGAGGLKKTVVRSCFPFSIKGAGLTPATGNCSSEVTPRLPSRSFTCIVSNGAGKLQTQWNPPQMLFDVGDSITFQNTTAAPVDVEFSKGSPFEMAGGSKTYTVPAGQSVALKVLRSGGVFDCGPEGVGFVLGGDIVPS